MSLRSDVADVLKANLPPEFHVMAYIKQLDNTARPVVMVHRSKVSKAPIDHLDHSVTIHVLVPETLGEDAEDKADEALDAVLQLVEKMNNIEWSTAERSTYENFAGFEITLTASTRNYFRSTT